MEGHRRRIWLEKTYTLGMPWAWVKWEWQKQRYLSTLRTAQQPRAVFSVGACHTQSAGCEDLNEQAEGKGGNLKKHG